MTSAPGHHTLQGYVWRNWSGLAHASESEVLVPANTDEVVAAVRRARESKTTVKMTGTGHSFTDIAAPEHTLLLPEALSGITAVDREAMTVTALAGTQLKDLNFALERLGLSLHNMGDIAEQTLAGATATGTHGSVGFAPALSPHLAGLVFFIGTGDVIVATESTIIDVFDVARVGLGALGVLTSLTFRVEPSFILEAHEEPMGWDRFVTDFEEITAGAHHVDSLWFPHTDRLMVKQNIRTALEPGEQDPPSALAAWWEDDFVSNTLFGAITKFGSRVPRAVPTMGQLAARALSDRTYSDLAHRVFVSPRRVVFREMEYAVPREVGIEGLQDCRRLIESREGQIRFPVEVRTAPAEDIALSTASGRDSLYLAFHVAQDVDHTAYFTEVEAILRAADGRPHWGKLHTCTATDLAPVYDRFGDFLAMRERLDPDRVFANAYLRRVLGD